MSGQTISLLKAPPHYGGPGFVFPGDKPEQPLSHDTMYRMGYRGRQTVHGSRRLASTWANEAEHYRSDLIEMALAHTERDEVRGAYNSALYLTPRRRMLQDWGDAVFAMMKGQGAEAKSAAPQLETTT